MMRILLITVLIARGFAGFTQSIQLHYDLRHTINGKRNLENSPVLYFDYFKEQDSGRGFVKPGSFFFKAQADLREKGAGIGQVYLQASQTFRFWQPKVFLHLQYSGGLGLANPRAYSYTITNAYSVGLSYPHRWGSAYLTSVLHFRQVAFAKWSRDLLYTLYWWKGLLHYKAEFSGDFSIWTENRNHGDDFTKNFKGKRFFFFAEPQAWLRLHQNFSVGTRINVFFHVNTNDNLVEVYPALALRCKF